MSLSFIDRGEESRPNITRRDERTRSGPRLLHKHANEAEGGSGPRLSGLRRGQMRLFIHKDETGDKNFYARRVS